MLNLVFNISLILFLIIVTDFVFFSGLTQTPSPLSGLNPLVDTKYVFRRSLICLQVLVSVVNHAE